MLARSVALALAVAVAAGAAPARATDGAWRLRLEAGPGFDGNALRMVGDGSPSSAAFSGGTLRAQGRLAGPRWTLDGRLSEGFRVFSGTPDANVLASQLDVAARWLASGALDAGIDAMARDLAERGGARDLREARALGRAGLRTGAVRWQAEAGWMISAPRAAGLEVFRRDGPELALSLAYTIAPEQVVALRYGLSAWRYRDWPGGRRDDEHAAGLEWRWDGPLLAAVGYTFGRNSSSVAAGSWRRHRVSARAAADLPLGLELAGRATVQRSVNRSGFILSEQLLVREGDESQNAVELQLARELRPRVELALKVAHYRSELGADAAFEFRRTVGQLALAWTAGD